VSGQLLLAVAMPERWPQVCRVKITFEIILTICFVSTTTNSMKCLVNWIPLNTHVRFENTQPCLKTDCARETPKHLQVPTFAKFPDLNSGTDHLRFWVACVVKM